LAPFDPIVWDRRRFELLWGWAYRFEAYTPIVKRKLGYYALPLLFRDQVTGWANVSVRERKDTKIALQPWGRVEGKLLIGDRPGSNQSMNIDSGDWGWELGSAQFPFIYEAKTDAEGRFVFTHVPGGRQRVARRHNNPHGLGAIGMSHYEFVEVEPGATSKVIIGGKGAVVSGKLMAVPSEPSVDWTLTVQRLALPGDSLTRMSGGNAYEFFCEADGSFTVPDVAPGDYKLRVRLTARPKGEDDINYSPGIGADIGKLERDVTVSETTEGLTPPTVDLGRIEVPVNP
jgi:hypothetical protein